MNLDFFIWEQGWQVAGWTMVYFLALGSFVTLLAAPLHWLLHNAAPTLRYTTSLAVFAVLAILPVGIAFWLSHTPVRELPITELAPDTTPQVIDLAITPIKTDAPATPLSSPAEQATAWTVSQAVEYFPWVWLVGTPLTFLLLATGLIGAERLRRASRIVTEGPVHEAADRLRAVLGVGRTVTIAVCERLAAPLMVGIVRPLILLPPAALTGWSTDQLEMVLLHELAHVRRWDNLVNLLQRVVESLLFFHPAVWIASRWVRRDREDCCDAVVVLYTTKPQAYAELLVELASPSQPLAGLAMAHHPLAGRIRRILHLEDETMLVSRNTLFAITTALLATVLAVSCHSPRETEAEEVTTNKTNSTSGDGHDPAEEYVKRVNEAWDAAVREVQRIKSAGKSVGLKVSDSDSFEVLVLSDATPENLNKKTAADNLLFKLIHTSAPNNPTRSEVYDLPPKFRNDGAHPIVDLFEGLERDPHGPQVRIDWKWKKNGKAVEMTVPAAAHWVWRNVFGPFEDLLNAQIKRSAEKKIVTKDSENNEAGEYEFSETKSKSEINKITETLEQEGKEVQYAKNKDGTITVRVKRRIEPTAADSSIQLPIPVFLSLENQRKVDMAYKSLGIELSLLGAVETERLKAMPFDGGLLVTSVKNNFVGRLRAGDLLVGLHVWPTPSLNALSEILTRDDLDKLTPLKFYVLRRQTAKNPPPGVYGRSGKDGEVLEELVTGRIPVDLDAWRVIRQQQKTVGQDVDANSTETAQLDQEILRLEHEFTHPENNHKQKLTEIALKKAYARKEQLLENREDHLQQQDMLLYGGKTFDEWRTLWKTELKTENRIECIKALAAFGRAGRGKEAIEAILDVASQYDFSVIDGSIVGKLKRQILKVFSPFHATPGKSVSLFDSAEWLPILMERYEAEPHKYRWLAWHLISAISPTKSKLAKSLQEMALSHTDGTIRQAALYAVCRSHGKDIPDSTIWETLSIALEDADSTVASAATSLIASRSWPPQSETQEFKAIKKAWLDVLVRLSLQKESSELQAHRQTLRRTGDQIAQLLTERFVSVLQSDKNKTTKIAALRALSVLQQGAVEAEPTLITLLTTTSDQDILISTANALAQLQTEHGSFRRTEPNDVVKACTPHFESLTQWPRYFKERNGLQLLQDATRKEYQAVNGSGLVEQFPKTERF